LTKHFIDLDDFQKNDIRQILDYANKIKFNQIDFDNALLNKSLGMIFEQLSLRTRLSFDIAMKKMGGYVVELDPKLIGLGKRESNSDIIRTISQYLDCIMIRNLDHERLKLFASYDYLSIINGLSNYSHPCQILSDIFTIEEKKGLIENQKITWCGDITNVCTSLLQASNVFKFKLNLSAPKQVITQNQALLDKYKSDNIKIFEDPQEAVYRSDCIMTDVWLSMGDSQNNEKLNLMTDYQINEKLMKKADKNAVFMHCLPAHRNREVTDAVIDGKQSIVWQQAQNRIYVQQSIINYCIT
jgi:ornithine carbamoyltransferase